MTLLQRCARLRQPEAGSAGDPRIGLREMTEPPRIAWGGKSLYGARVGILMLETRFPRLPGDMGNAETWPFPVIYKVVPGASPSRVVCDKAEGLLDEFLAAAGELVRLGADGVTTTCGFLSLYQREISAHVGVPVATSSLMQIPLIERALPPGKRVGVLTVSAANLTEQHLLAAGHALVTSHPDVGAVLLECTNMVPYARALSERLRLPVFSIYTFVTWFQAGLVPRDFGHPASALREWRER